MLSLHADWAVGDDRAFRAAARNALGVAAEYDVLVTVGVKPSRNETAYGYIVPGKSLGSARAVRRFVEKPSAARAMLLRRRGALWNTGLFAWGVARFLGEAGPTRASCATPGPPSRRGTCRGSSPRPAPSPWASPCSSAPGASRASRARSAGTTSDPWAPCSASGGATRAAMSAWATPR